ncbi:MAG: DUF4411 family protein [Sedimentisphaerales bacterium]|nr:DUF4411 family protein [Sedimentisphaerales bacterium]
MDCAKYVLDANVFIEAARRYYAFDIAPAFWENLIQYATSGQLQGIDRVKQELERGKDELAAWTTSQFNSAFVSTDEEGIIESYSDVMRWVQAQSQFSDVAKADFANSADGWLIACAKSKGFVLVTHEVLDQVLKEKFPFLMFAMHFIYVMLTHL